MLLEFSIPAIIDVFQHMLCSKFASSNILVFLIKKQSTHAYIHYLDKTKPAASIISIVYIIIIIYLIIIINYFNYSVGDCQLIALFPVLHAQVTL